MYEFIVINADGKVPTAYGSRGSTSSASFGYASRRARNIYWFRFSVLNIL